MVALKFVVRSAFLKSNVGGTATILKRAQRLWDLTGDSDDPALWQAIAKAFEPQPRRLRSQEWTPNLDFIRAVWRGAGRRDPEFAVKIANAYTYEDRETLGADVLLEVFRTSEPTGLAASRCIVLLDVAGRADEAGALIQQLKAKLANDPQFVSAWARRALRRGDKDALLELVHSPALRSISPSVAIQVYFRSGLMDEAVEFVDPVLREVAERRLPRGTLTELADIFDAVGVLDRFEALVTRLYPDEIGPELRERFESRRISR